MAVTVYKYPKPKLYLQLVSGGSLPVADYFFMGFYTQHSEVGYWGNGYSGESEEASITTTAGNQSIKIEWFNDGGNIQSISDAGAGDVTVIVSGTHTRDNSDTVYIRGTTSYDGDYTISNVTTSGFDITKAYSGTETGEWFADAGLPTAATRICFKWDNYTMIDPSTGYSYSWCNVNDPAISSETTNLTYGHRKWTMRYHQGGEQGTNATFDEVLYADANWQTGKLYDGTGGSRYCSRSMDHTGLARRPEAKLPTGFSYHDGTLYIECSGNNDVNDLIDALQASGYTDMYSVGSDNVACGAMNRKGFSIILNGYFRPVSGTTTINNTSILFVGAGCISDNTNSTWLVFNSCWLGRKLMSDNHWTNLYGTFNDTMLDYDATCILDYCIANNFSPNANSMTFYRYSYSGFNMINKSGFGLAYWQWRYPIPDEELSDFYVSGIYCYWTGSPSITGYEGTFYLTDIDWVMKGYRDRDIHIRHNYYSGYDLDFIMECCNNTSDRDDGKIRVCFQDGNTPESCSHIFNMRFRMDLVIVDEKNIPIEGALVTITDSDGGVDTDTSDSDGVADVKGLSYTIEYDDDDTDGYGFETKTSDYLTNTLVITKTGYETFIRRDMTLTEGKQWEIKLQPRREV
jgi:hypothetical protein